MPQLSKESIAILLLQSLGSNLTRQMFDDFFNDGLPLLSPFVYLFFFNKLDWVSFVVWNVEVLAGNKPCCPF